MPLTFEMRLGDVLESEGWDIHSSMTQIIIIGMRNVETTRTAKMVRWLGAWILKVGVLIYYPVDRTQVHMHVQREGMCSNDVVHNNMVGVWSTYIDT